MRYKEIIKEAMLVKIGKSRINFPGDEDQAGIENYDFKRQQKNYEALKAILARNGMKFEWFATSQKQHTTIIAGVGPKDNAKFVWYKYEGNTPGSGQNYVYGAGLKIQLTAFLELKPSQQDGFVKNEFKEPGADLSVGDVIKFTCGDVCNIGKIKEIRRDKLKAFVDVVLMNHHGKFNGREQTVRDATVEQASQADIDQYLHLFNSRSIKNLIASGEMERRKVDKYAIEAYYCDITSLDGCPEIVSYPGGNAVDVQHNRLVNLLGGPKEVYGNYLCQENFIETLDGVASIIEGNLNLEDNRLTSLQDIHKKIKRLDGSIDLTNNPLQSNILGLLLIPGIKSVFLDNDTADDIINKFLGKGRAGLLSCQTALIEAGLGDFAKL